MPCFNELADIRTILDRVLASPWVLEVIVVDDGSDDGTREVLREVTDPRVRVLEQPMNLGKGAALRRGFREVTAPYVVVQDADLEYDPADYPRLLQPILDDKADVVFGSRFAGESHRVLFFWQDLEPAPGAYSSVYLARIEQILDWAERYDVQVILDAHQDVYGEEFGSGGIPSWATRMIPFGMSATPWEQPAPAITA